jgi:predicted 3-demethylubiquinone-9 3-methyltransferase (glyoxalase superfamily)
MPTVTPFLWFDSQAEDAMQLYLSVFPNAKSLTVQRAGDRVMSVEFEVEGQRVIALNGGPHYRLNEAFSFLVSVETQDEIDKYWSKLTANGGEPGQCGWLKDKFGVSWQVVPASLGRFLSGGGDPARAKRVMDVFFQMKKIDISRLQAAYDGT